MSDNKQTENTLNDNMNELDTYNHIIQSKILLLNKLVETVKNKKEENEQKKKERQEEQERQEKLYNDYLAQF